MAPELIVLNFVLSIIGVYSTECTYTNSSANYVTYCDLNNTLREQLISRFEVTAFHDFIAKSVRLVFHDCMGPQEYNMDGTGSISICDGCLDVNNSAHANLYDDAIAKLEKAYKRDWQNRISRADYWAAAATVALQFSNNLSMTTDLHNSFRTNDTLPYIPFYIGRTDCSASPFVDISNYPEPYKSFPDGLEGWAHNFGFFRDNFGFDEKEYTAILGAHTLGRVIAGNSGFGTAPWVQAWDIIDNEFYHVLLDDRERTKKAMKWQQFVNTNSSDGIERFEWKNTQGGATANFVMLNSDMALLFDFDDDIDINDGGRCACNYSSCRFNNKSKDYVQSYADSNQEWLDDFGAAFRKMILMGYDNVNDIPTDLDVLAEDWYLEEYGLINVTGTTTTSASNDGTNHGATLQLIVITVLCLIVV